ncbi:MAG: transposase [Clostridiales bacterium]|nr:transposase [Clostridiales bacterium]
MGSNKRYVSKSKTGRPPKDNRVIFNAILWFVRSGVAWADISQGDMVLIKLFTVVFANSVTMLPFCAFSKF